MHWRQHMEWMPLLNLLSPIRWQWFPMFQRLLIQPHWKCQHQHPERPVSDVFGKERLRELGYSEEVIKKLELSHASSTRRQYKSKWTLFVAWSSRQTPPLDPTSPSEVALAGFLTHLFDERKKETTGQLSHIIGADCVVTIHHWTIT